MIFREDVSLTTKRALSPPLMNGGGSCKYLEDVELLTRAPVGAVVVGSMTVRAREGNSGNVWDPKRGLNALGMPNPGKPYYSDHLAEMAAVTHAAEKVFVANIAGETPEEYGELAKLAADAGADLIEVNLGCPNMVTKHGGRKPVAFFSLKLTEAILEEVNMCTPRGFPKSAKVSPSSDPDYIPLVAEIFKANGIWVVTAVNTFPKGYEVDSQGNPVISVGYAGVSGSPLRAIGPGQVRQWREAMGKEAAIIAAGGISCGLDIRQYEQNGADAFQMTTAILGKNQGQLDPAVFERVIHQYGDI